MVAVDIVNFSDRFEFDDDILGYKIQPVPSNHVPLERDGNRYLSVERDIAIGKRHAHRSLIDRFTEPGTEGTMHR